jgi:hypothetical protein
MRISGVDPSHISVLLIHLEAARRKQGSSTWNILNWDKCWKNGD